MADSRGKDHGRPGTRSPAAKSGLASVPDDELDAYIADLILQKSRATEARSQTQGIGAYLTDEVVGQSTVSNQGPIHNTNKHFLASVIRNVEGHNRALLRQQIREAERAARDSQPITESSSAMTNGTKTTDADKAAPSNSSKPSRSKMRGWSDESLDYDQDSADGVSTSAEAVKLSSKMDKYFDAASSDRNAALPASVRPSEHRDGEKSTRRRKEPRTIDREHSNAPAHSSSDRDGIHRPTSEQTECERRRHDKERDRKSGRSRDKARHSDRDGHRDRDRSRRSERQADHRDEHGKSSQSTSKRRDSHPKRSRHEEGSSIRHRASSRSKQRRSASPAAEPPRKVREWDLGKDSLAF